MILAALFRFSADSLRVSFQVLFEIAVIISLAVFLFRDNPWLTLFLIIVCFSHYWPAYNRHSFLAMHAVLYGLLWYLVLRMLVVNSDRLMDAMVIIAIANCLLMLLQAFNLDPLYRPIRGGHDLATGFMSNRNETSALLAFCLPAFFRGRWLLLLPLLLVGLVLAQSVGGILGAVTGAVFILTAQRPGSIKFVFPVAVIVLVVFCWLVDPPGINHRLQCWLPAIAAAKKRLLGYGLGNWKVVTENVRLGGTRFFTVHNEFIQGWFESGLLFFVPLIGYATRLIKRFSSCNWEADNQVNPSLPLAALIIIAVNSAVNFPFHVATTAMIAVTWLVIMEDTLQGSFRWP
jgi:hypothetical protein